MGSTDDNNLSNVFDSISDSLYKRDTLGNVIKIGNQVWMKKNLNVDKFRNGDPIAQAKTPQDWRLAGDEKKPVWCYYNFDFANGVKYGKLYNWYAVTDLRGLAPNGFHVPNSYETAELDQFVKDFLDYDKTKCHWYDVKRPKDYPGNPVSWHTHGCPSGEKLKSSTGWSIEDNVEYKGMDAVGFSALPGGKVYSVYNNYDPPHPECTFWGEGYDAYWWTSVESDELHALYFQIDRDEFVHALKPVHWEYKTSGLAVRCIMD
jgi:uncharacterized protein (TIGR02145 family)